jgi:tRNA threonylcarbamoyl adenosine modification protein YjeE
MSMKKIFLTQSERETKELALFLLNKLSKKNRIIFALDGELGGGKTVFVKGLAKGLKIKEKIVSPSFLLLKKYSVEKHPYFKELYHLDCYRLRGKEKSFFRFIKKIFKKRKIIVAIEWAEKIKKYLPKKVYYLYFEIIGKRKRKILFYER